MPRFVIGAPSDVASTCLIEDKILISKWSSVRIATKLSEAKR